MSSKRVSQIVLAALLGGTYLLTLAPGLTWANYGADGGDLFAAAATNGIAHPSGYPTYLLLARLFLGLPFGSPPFRLNLMSAAFAVCAALLVYEIAAALKPESRRTAWVAALAFGVSPLFWSQAVVAEVYTLHAFFVALLFWLELKEAPPFLFGLTFGLSLGNHITTALLFPLLLHRDKATLLKRGAGLALGAAVYLLLPLRAAQHPPVNWGDPATLSGFLWLTTGSLYRGQLFALPLAALWGKIQTAAALLLEQFGGFGLLLGFAGLLSLRAPARLTRSLAWTAAISSLFALFYNVPDWFLHLLPAFLCFSVWMGIGLARGMEWDARLKPALALILLVLVGFRAAAHWTQADASRDSRAEDFARRALAEFPPEAVVFTEGDEATLALWGYHYGLGARPDVAFIASDLLQNEWYQQSLRQNYPALNLPEEFFMFPSEVTARNPRRAACYVSRSLSIRCR